MGISHLHRLCAVALYGVAAACWAGEAGKVVLSVGTVHLQDHPVKVGDSVRPGDQLRTGADGYIYIKTVDNGFLILRPNSAANIVAYETDAATPANSRFKIELQQGVARSISGQAVKNARQNFRFNTPVAAIGVRGTDFTVFTDAQTSRVAVLSGGVVVSGFGPGCTPEGSGPCETADSRELFARQNSEVLQIRRGQQVPEFVHGKALQPDSSAPPLADEPGKTSRNSSRPENTVDSSLTPLKLAELGKIATGGVLFPPGNDTALPAISWGRWQAAAGQAANLDLKKISADYRIVALTEDFALYRQQNATWQAPSGNVSFALQGSMAQIQRGDSVQLASLENASLAIDFNRSRFATRFDLVAPDLRLTRQAQGNVGSDGTFSNPNQFLDGNNMLVQGVLANTPNGTAAGYTFQSRVDDHTLASGVTHWTSK